MSEEDVEVVPHLFQRSGLMNGCDSSPAQKIHTRDTFVILKLV